MKKIIYFIMIFAAVFAALGLASCRNDDDEMPNRVYYTDADLPIYIPYVNDFVYDYYTPDGEKIEDKTTAFNYNDKVMVKIGFTISADAFAAGKSRFTLSFKPTPGFEGRIISANSSSTDDLDFTATFTTDNKPKNCYIQTEITFGCCGGALRIKYRYDDDEYVPASFGPLNHNNPIKFTYDVATDGYILGQNEKKHFDYDANTTEMLIPDEYNGKPITGIGSNFFSSGRFRNISLPSTLKTIGTEAFKDCWSLQSIVIPDSVTSIGVQAFLRCNALKEVILPDGIKNIGDSVFVGCDNLTYSQYDKGLYLGSAENKYLYLAKVALGDATGVTVHENCKIIGEFAFSKRDGSGLPSLTSVNLPDGLKVIGTRAFSGCSALTSVNLPDGLEVIGDSAFYRCSALTDMAIPDDIPDLGASVFEGCEKLYTEDEYGYYIASKNNKHAVFIKTNHSADVRIKDGCVAIGSYAFSDSWLRAVVLPDSLKSIGAYAFENCERLDNITIPSSVTSIGSGVFSGCKSLKSVTLPDTLENLSAGTFRECESLKTVVLPKNLMRIGYSAFALCGIETLTLPDTLVEICASAFDECKNLQSLTIPDSVVNIGEKAFSLCSSLTSITLPATLERIEDETFEGCRSLEDVTLQLPRNLDYIGRSALSWETSFVGSRRAWMELISFSSQSSSWGLASGGLVHCIDGDLEYDFEGYIYE